MTPRTAPALRVIVAVLLALAGGWAGPAARGAGEPTPTSSSSPTPGVAAAATAGLPPVETLPVEQFNVVVEKTNTYTAALNVAQEVHRAHDANGGTANAKRGAAAGNLPSSTATILPPEGVAKVKAAVAFAPRPPALPAADAAIGELAAAFEALTTTPPGNTKPPPFARLFAAETALRAAVAEVRPLVERRQLAVGEQARGRDFGWHVRGVLGAVKPLVELIPAAPPPPSRPPMDPKLYAARLADLDAAWTALDAYANAHPPEIEALPDGAALRGDLGTLVTAARQLRPALEAKKLDRATIGKRINELISRYNAAVKRVNAAALGGG